MILSSSQVDLVQKYVLFYRKLMMLASFVPILVRVVVVVAVVVIPCLRLMRRVNLSLLLQ